MKNLGIVLGVLSCMGYEPIHDEEKRNIHFVSHGFENFTDTEKDVIRQIMCDDLLEFYYAHSTQYIYYR